MGLMRLIGDKTTRRGATRIDGIEEIEEIEEIDWRQGERETRRVGKSHIFQEYTYARVFPKG